MNENKKYKFSGCVLRFGRVIERNWSAVTYATSERKALNNLTYRYKKENNFDRNANITLDGSLTIV